MLFTPEEFDEYVKEVCDQPNLDRPTYVPLNPAVVKKGQYQGLKFDSKWEAAFYIYYHDIECQGITRNTTEWIYYFSESGKEKKWYPDFILEGRFVEVKGQFRPDDYQKRAQHPEIDFYDSERMKPILAEVYRRFPRWEAQYLPR